MAETIQLTIGRPWTPNEFFQKALDSDHPYSQPGRLTDMLARCAFKVITVGPKELKRQRAALLVKWEKRLRELAPAELRELLISSCASWRTGPRPVLC